MQKLDVLAEQLLRGGVGYRHVRRFIAELRDHYDDAVRSEAERGADPAGAQAAALARIGDADDLAREMIARPELRSLNARFPRLWGGTGPLAVWLGMVAVLILVLFILGEGLEAAGFSGGSPAFAPLQGPADAFLFFVVRGLPILIGAALVFGAIRQRADLTWPIIGAVLLAMIAATADAQILFSLTPETKGEVRFGFGFASRETPQVLLRVGCMCALMLAPVLLRKRLTRPPV